MSPPGRDHYSFAGPGDVDPTPPHTNQPTAASGHIQCCICLGPIPFEQYAEARVWSDPGHITCAAHAACLERIGDIDTDDLLP